MIDPKTGEPGDFESFVAEHVLPCGTDPSMPLPERPSQGIDWPDNLDDLGYRDIGALLTRLAAWRAYGRAFYGEFEAARGLAEEMLAKERARLLATSGEEKVTVARAKAEQDPGVLRLSRVAMEGAARVRLLRGRLEALDALYQTASRIVTVREQEHQNAGPTRDAPTARRYEP